MILKGYNSALRHSPESIGKLWAVPLAALLMLAAIAHAQIRTLPPEARRATVGQQQYPLPFVDLGGAKVKLAPGGLIFDQHNRTIVHNALPPGANVVFTTDIHGDIRRIYILTPQEQAQFVQKQ
jgi:hypothetical protein